jgi:hypothetical protein
VRLAHQQPVKDVLRLGVLARCAAHPLTSHRVNLPVDRQERHRLHHLALGETERLGAPAEPPAWRLPRLRRVHVVAARGPLASRLIRLGLSM